MSSQSLLDCSLSLIGRVPRGVKVAGSLLLALLAARKLFLSSAALQHLVILRMVKRQFLTNAAVSKRWFALKPTEHLDRDEEARKRQFAVVLVGTSSPLAHRTRAKTCTAVVAGGKMWLVDAGPMITNSLGLLRAPLGQVGGVLFTHYHSDHIGDLGELNLQLWAAQRKDNLKVYGPPGIQKLVSGFNTAYELDMGYRVAHHGPEAMNPATAKMEAVPFDVAESGETVVLVDRETGLRIAAFSVTHSPVEPAVGYKFSYLGRSIVISGDCTADSPALKTAAQNVDILVHEAQANHLLPLVTRAITDVDSLHPEGFLSRAQRGAKTIMEDIPSYHTSPGECAEIANAVNAKLLVMNHLTPPPANGVVAAIFARDVEGIRAKWRGWEERWVLGDDGMGWELEAAPSKVIRKFSVA